MHQEDKMQTSRYRSASRVLLGQATRELADGDARQASEKGWGAAAQMVKAVAEDRGWQHNGHALLYEVVRSLAEGTSDRQISTLFHVAGNLDTNFYEDWFSPETVASGLRDVESFLDKLDSWF